MKQDHLDHIIKSKIGEFQPEFKDEHWALFEGRLDVEPEGTPVGDTDTMDQLVFAKLHNFSAPTTKQAMHWSMLLARLRSAADLRNSLIQYKLLEGALVLLLLLIVFDWQLSTPVEYTPITEQPIAAVATPLHPTQNVPAVSAKELQPRSATEVEQTANDTRQNNPTPDVGGEITASDLTDVADEGALPDSRMSDPEPVSSIAALPQRAIVPVASSLDGKLENKPAALPAPPTDILTAAIDQEFGPSPFINRYAAQRVWSTQLMSESLPALQTPRSTGLVIGMFGGADYNRVITPPDRASGIRKFDRYTLGYRGGISLGWQTGRFEIGTGVIYAAKQYQPQEVAFIGGGFAGYTVETLQDIELNILNVPVYARYDFLRKNKWRMYTQAGLSLQVAFEANYYVAYPNIPLPGILGQTPVRSSRIPDRDVGWFQGGSFKENSFITANLGLGLERNMTDRWSMFFQSNLEHTLGYFSEGLGPYHDRIHTMSVLTGIRVRLRE